MPPQSTTSSPSVQLPFEILALITVECDRITLKQIRLCNKWLAKEATNYLFASISFETRLEDLERIVAIANSTNKIASAVKVLKLHQTPRLHDYSFTFWCRKRADIWDPEKRFNNLVDGDQVKLDLIHHRLESFHAYRTQQSEPTLYQCLNYHGPSLSERMQHGWPLREDRESVDAERPHRFLRRFQQACLDFEEAVPKFPNLHMFWAHFPPQFKWNGFLASRPEDFEPPLRTTEQVAPIAFVLRALGRRSSINSSLGSIKLDLFEAARWGLNHVEQGLIPEEFEGPLQCQALMDAAFTHVTGFDLVFNQDHRQNFRKLPSLFSVAKNLVRLKLATHYYSPGNWMDPHMDMLKHFNDIAQWPKLEYLELVKISFTSGSLICSLLHLAPTLKSLVLRQCLLQDDKVTWSDIYTRMRPLPFEKLHHMHFQECIQAMPHPEGLEEYPRVLFFGEPCTNPSLVLHHTGLIYNNDPLAGFSSEIYDYILKKTDTMPIQQLYNVIDYPDLFGDLE